MTDGSEDPLGELAARYGIQREYTDGFGHLRTVPAETLLLTLRALGAGVESPAQAQGALRHLRVSSWSRLAEPVAVVWEDHPLELELRVRSGEAQHLLKGSLLLEDGERRQIDLPCDDLPVLEREEVEGTVYLRKRLDMTGPLPWGYHRLTLETPVRRQDVLVIAAARQAYLPPELVSKKTWGVFVPLYALHSAQRGAGGDLSDLERVVDWVSERGGAYVATLPLLASFLDESFNPSPYSPVSRLFWNECYLDLAQIPELEQCPGAKQLMGSTAFLRELQALRALPQADSRRLMALKRAVLERLSEAFFSQPSPRRDRFEAFLKRHPSLQHYARFRAVSELRRTPWTEWPASLRQGDLQAGEYAREAEHYHLYVQWVAHEQVKSVAQKARQKSLGLYLDYPLGVHPFGYDVWSRQQAFVTEMSVGAPADAFFPEGQRWGFPPLHPARSRELGHEYVIAALRHHLKAAGILRLDHVMGLHRLFWIPQGMKASEGCYVGYPSEELYGILCVESHRSRTILVGEDLGTVPPQVRPAMRAHGIFQMYVAQFGLTGNAASPLEAIPSRCMASLDTHDTPTFSGFLQGLDIEERSRCGLLNAQGAARERAWRTRLQAALVAFLKQKGWGPVDQDPLELTRACLKLLSLSDAAFVLVSLEDLWGETRPHNVPGTWVERTNWVGKTRYALEEMFRMPAVVEVLEEINRCRTAVSPA